MISLIFRWYRVIYKNIKHVGKEAGVSLCSIKQYNLHVLSLLFFSFFICHVCVCVGLAEFLVPVISQVQTLIL